MKGVTLVIEGGTIQFLHPHPPKGAHKTHAPWLDRKLEKVEPIELGSAAYHQLVGAIYCQTGRDVTRERRSDNKLVAQIGGFVFREREPKG